MIDTPSLRPLKGEQELNYIKRQLKEDKKNKEAIDGRAQIQ